ncbi:glycosyltransferase [Alsobacter soli]
MQIFDFHVERASDSTTQNAMNDRNLNVSRIVLMSKVWRSGTGWYAQSLANAIAQIGHDITFISPRALPEEREPAGPHLIRVFVPRELVSEGSRFRKGLASLWRIFVGSVAVARRWPRTTSYIFTIPEPLPFTLPLFLYIRAMRGRLIFVVHDVEPHAWRFRGGLRRLEAGAHALSYRLATHLVVLTSAAKARAVAQHNIDPAKITVIPHGAFPLAVQTPMPGSRVLLSFGTVRRNKNILETIRGVHLARRRGTDVRLLVAGEPHPHEPDYWQICKEAAALDQDAILFADGFIPDAEVPQLLARVDALVLAYADFSSQSGVAVLAGVNNRPVIATTAGGLQDLFDQGLAGELVATPVTAEAIADAIVRFYEVPVETWQDRADVAAQLLRRALSWDKIGASFIALSER